MSYSHGKALGAEPGFQAASRRTGPLWVVSTSWWETYQAGMLLLFLQCEGLAHSASLWSEAACACLPLAHVRACGSFHVGVVDVPRCRIHWAPMAQGFSTSVLGIAGQIIFCLRAGGCSGHCRDFPPGAGSIAPPQL